MGQSDTESTSSSMRGNPGSPRDISVLLDDSSADIPGFQHPAPISPSASTSSSETSDLDNSVIITSQTPKRTDIPVIDLTSPDEGDEGAARTHGSFGGNLPCEDFAQFASNYRWRIHGRDPRSQRFPLPDNRLRSRRFPRRHLPYSNLWERVPAPSNRHDPLLAELADLVPRPSPPADSNSPIIIDDERSPFTQHQVPPNDAPSWFLSDRQHRMERFRRRLNATRQAGRCYLQSDEALAYRLQQAEYTRDVEEHSAADVRQPAAARVGPLHAVPHMMHQPLQLQARRTGRRPFHTSQAVASDLFLPFVSVVSIPPPPLHHYGDSNQGLSAEGEDYEALWNLSERIGLAKARGLSKEVIDNIPSFRYSASSRDFSNGNCVVCMSDYINREKLRRLPCNHDFHAKCIDRWLKNNRTCPVCREVVMES
ncbi:E3 ubiquitin-protein ligase RNF38-like [Montipora foliosa]|uniref:E3 ubiquitin-protein ligase RNF38-like n=1 Tax=Montipora foliosa TaxID=591990 RepID=UPI0035F1E939